MTRAAWRGYNPPFFGGPANVMSPQSDERLIKNDLLSLLLTVPGERRNRRDYGCRLRLFVFEPANDGLADDLRNEIARAITKYEPRVTIARLNVAWYSVTQLYRIDLAVYLNNAPTQELLLELNFSSAGVSNVR